MLRSGCVVGFRLSVLPGTWTVTHPCTFISSGAGSLMNTFLPIRDQNWNLRVGNDYLSHFTDEDTEAKMRCSDWSKSQLLTGKSVNRPLLSQSSFLGRKPLLHSSVRCLCFDRKPKRSGPEY